MATPTLKLLQKQEGMVLLPHGHPLSRVSLLPPFCPSALTLTPATRPELECDSSQAAWLDAGQAPPDPGADNSSPEFMVCRGTYCCHTGTPSKSIAVQSARNRGATDQRGAGPRPRSS